jgi:hypothetical protein
MTLRARLTFATIFGCALLSSPGPVTGQEKIDGTKAKAAAAENLKKIKIAKPTVVETDNFVVAGSLPEEKAKALGAVLEKTLGVARKAAKYDDKEVAWKGKLTVYYLPDGAEYKSFMRGVLQKTPEGVYVDTRSEPALLVDPAEPPPGGKATDADLYASTAARVAGELLKAKGTGTQVIPEWLRDGFGRVAVMKAEGPNSKRYQLYRTQARAAILTPKGGRPPAISEVWSGAKSDTSDLLANSLAEFLAFGPKSAEFGKLIDALRPDGNQTPMIQAGLMAMGWKDDMMADAAWKTWVRTGR